MAALVAAGCLAAPASAHNAVVSTTPADGETLTALPEAFSITTSADLLDLEGRPGGFAYQVQDASGAYYGDGCVTVSGATMSVVPALGAPGEYHVAWAAVSGDGHPIGGELGFTWAPTGQVEPAPAWAAPPVCGEEGIPVATSAPTASAAEEPGPAQPQPGAEPGPSEEQAATASPGPNAQQDGDPWWIAALLGGLVAIGGAVAAVLTARRHRAGS